MIQNYDVSRAAIHFLSDFFGERSGHLTPKRNYTKVEDLMGLAYAIVPDNAACVNK